jgi:hypothetical protein
MQQYRKEKEERRDMKNKRESKKEEQIKNRIIQYFE